ncbi:YcxB family protein [Streptomyces sp. NPDC090022]|uniref:YcxB family protein n=1 Tax=Streptomyces sp. NPDC090022 TaxID=3365920 RepID=UPI00380D173D
MEATDIPRQQDAQVTGEVVLRFTGTLDKSEIREGFKAAGAFRRLRWFAATCALVIALVGVRVDAGGGSVNFVFVALAVVYGSVMYLVLSRQGVAKALRVQRDHEGAECVVDGTGIAAVLDGAEAFRTGWDQLTRYHETPRLYVVMGGTGLRTKALILPKRLLTAPGEADLLGAVLDSRLRRA